MRKLGNIDGDGYFVPNLEELGASECEAAQEQIYIEVAIRKF